MKPDRDVWTDVDQIDCSNGSGARPLEPDETRFCVLPAACCLLRLLRRLHVPEHF